MKKLIWIIVLLIWIVFGVTFVKADDKEPVLIIGDSRCVGMSQYNDSYYWACKVGASCSLVNNDLILGSCDRNDLGTSDIVSGVSKLGIKKIVYCLGVNNPYESDKAIATIKSLKNKTGCKVYYLACMPGVSSKASEHGMTIDNNQIKAFNAKVKKGIKGYAKYLSAYKYIIKIDNWSSHTSDGVHYDSYLYKKVLKFIKRKI